MLDSLTGLLSRAQFDADVALMVRTSAQDNQPLSLVIADIDRFKAVNDTHGHQIGDQVLVEVSRRLQSVVLGKGKVYRYGGEEITILLPNYALEEAVAVAERARATLAAQEMLGVRITASFGVASHPLHAGDCATLFKAADDALYDAKNRGRDLVRASGEPEPAAPGPRQPRRKLPEPGELTEHQRQDLRRRHFQGDRITCPKDGAIFKVIDTSSGESAGEDIVVICPLCGLRESLLSGG